MSVAERPLRIALLTYRGNPHCGGQGIYTRYLAHALVELGHHVEVFSGQPYPELSHGVHFTPIPSLDLFRPGYPWHIPAPWRLRSRANLAELALTWASGFPEPYTFSLRIQDVLRKRRNEFDIVHDNQCLGTGLMRVMDDLPLLATLHHPVTVDRDLELQHARSAWKRFTLRRWYGFLGMQMRTARSIKHIVTVSQSSRRDIVAQMGVPAEHLSVVPIGVDTDRFRPLPHIARVPKRIMVTTSSDVPLKGLVPLLEAMAKVRTEHDDAHLVVIGKPRAGSVVPATIERLGIKEAVTFLSGVSDERFVELYAEASLAVVPSLYEGFSLPAIEAMACGVPLVATTGGALPEVVGDDGTTAILVEPNDPSALSGAIVRLLDDADLRDRISTAGRRRVFDRYTWKVTAEMTVEQYRRTIATWQREHPGKFTPTASGKSFEGALDLTEPFTTDTSARTC